MTTTINTEDKVNRYDDFDLSLFAPGRLVQSDLTKDYGYILKSNITDEDGRFPSMWIKWDNGNISFVYTHHEIEHIVDNCSNLIFSTKILTWNESQELNIGHMQNYEPLTQAQQEFLKTSFNNHPIVKHSKDDNVHTAEALKYSFLSDKVKDAIKLIEDEFRDSPYQSDCLRMDIEEYVKKHYKSENVKSMTDDQINYTVAATLHVLFDY